MIRQEGYGQIYGDMGGATVGASIYKAARENVTFARMVELQRLNLAKRQLRMQQAQAAANADLSRRRLDLDNTRLELEARRLDLVDKQNEEQRLRTEKAYDATQCPSCGAPIKLNQAGKCEYCGTVVTGGNFDWVLSRIEQDESYFG